MARYVEVTLFLCNHYIIQKIQLEDFILPLRILLSYRYCNKTCSQLYGTQYQYILYGTVGSQ